MIELTKVLIISIPIFVHVCPKALNETATYVPAKKAADNSKKTSSGVMLDKCHEKVFDQHVSIEGCNDITIKSRKCIGLCNSYYDPLMKMFQLCFSCLPNVQPFEVTVLCVGAGGQEKSQQLKTDIVTGCKCSKVSCHPSDYWEILDKIKVGRLCTKINSI